MPKSKRSKIITLANTQKRGAERKKELIENIRFCAERYPYLYIFTTHNSRTSHLKDVRCQWNTSRFFFGKNKVMQIALGRDPSDEVANNMHLCSERIYGNCGLFFTDAPKKDVIEFFKKFKVKDFARTGQTATERVFLKKGPLENFAHTLLTHLRNLGLPVMLQNGVIMLEKDVEVCEPGTVLTPEQASIVKLLGIKMSEFKLTLRCMYHKGVVIDFSEEGGEVDANSNTTNTEIINNKNKLNNKNNKKNNNKNKQTTNKRNYDAEADEDEANDAEEVDDDDEDDDDEDDDNDEPIDIQIDPKKFFKNTNTKMNMKMKMKK